MFKIQAKPLANRIYLNNLSENFDKPRFFIIIPFRIGQFSYILNFLDD